MQRSMKSVVVQVADRDKLAREIKKPYHAGASQNDHQNRNQTRWKLLRRRESHNADLQPQRNDIPSLYICRRPSARRRLPNSQALSRPCSERSMLFMFGASAAGARLTREAIRTGSVSRIIPSSMISSMVRQTLNWIY